MSGGLTPCRQLTVASFMAPQGSLMSEVNVKARCFE